MLQFTSLGHTEGLIQWTYQGQSIRLLVDSWLSDTSPSDFMERMPKVQIDWQVFPKIHGVSLSHSHGDHLDPYFLTQLYQHQGAFDIFLPYTIEHLSEILKKYLPGCEIRKVSTEAINWNGAQLCGLRFAQDTLSNEEEVLALGIHFETSAILLEIDSPIQANDEHFEQVQQFFAPAKKAEIVFCRNDLEYLLPLFDAKVPQQRNEILKTATAQIGDEIQYFYEYLSETKKSMQDWIKNKQVRIRYVGGGLRFPSQISPELSQLYCNWNELRTSLAQDICKDMGWDATFPIHTVLPPGITFTSQIKPLQQSMCKEIFKRNFRPLEAREIPENWKEILLPYLEKFSTILYSHDLAYVLERKNNNHLNYTIELRGKWGDSLQWFTVQMNPKGITIHTCDSSNPTADEDYWIEDILLFIEGKIDVYGNFCIKLDLERGYRFWTFLGMNFLHPQIIENKLQFHFEAAKTQTCASITWGYN